MTVINLYAEVEILYLSHTLRSIGSTVTVGNLFAEVEILVTYSGEYWKYRDR